MAPYDAQSIIQAVGKRTDCILRVPLNDEIWIRKRWTPVRGGDGSAL